MSFKSIGRFAGLGLCALVLNAPAVYAASNSWAPGPGMNAARFGHSATVLPDGRVLMAGGGTNPDAEIYDPATNSWQATGRLNIARNYPKAALLKDGRVLVVGGQNPSTGAALNSAELYNAATRNAYVAAAERYDPTTRKWGSAGAMAVPRRNAAVVRLQSGRVLVAGGDTGGSLSSAELYDPSSNTWSTTGSMVLALGLSPGVLLSDGRVLVAGASYQGNVYSPTTGTWTTTGYQAFTDLQESAAALLPNGTVLLAGGATFGCDSTGDYCDYTPTNRVQTYTP